MDQGGRVVAVDVASSCWCLDVRDRQLWPMAASISTPPIAQGEARVWFYRDAGPFDSQEIPYSLMNGTPIGVSYPRGAFYLDVRPGFYHIAVRQYLSNPEEDANIQLVPGQQVYLKICH